MSRKWTLKYGSAAVLFAVAIIAASLLVNPSMLPGPVGAAATFTVMLTDPPTVPTGTTKLNLAYSDLLLHVTYPNETVEWLSVGASGTVNLFTLINMTQTLATTTFPVGSAVDKMQFTISDVEAVINGTTYDVTALSSTLVVNVADGYVNQTLSGVLIDFNPTLVQIQASDADGTLQNYYVLVPSATAVVIGELSEAQRTVGTIVRLGENHRIRLVRVRENFDKNVEITSASLLVDNNITTLSVTLKNEGEYAFRIFGFTLHGEINASRTWHMSTWEMFHPDTASRWQGMFSNMFERIFERFHPSTIPFKVNDFELQPLFGTHRERNYESPGFSSLTLQPGEIATLTYSGVIALQTRLDSTSPEMVLTPIIGEIYTLRLMGEGFQTFSVTATAVP